jgi:hypothetical protein
MAHHYFEGWPIELREDSRRGRYVVATRDIPAREIVFSARSLLVSVFDSYKKRVCGHCFAFVHGRLTHKCLGCSRVFYCSLDCKQANEPAHGPFCRFAAALPGHKFDHETTVMIHLLGEVHIRRLLSHQADASAIPLPCMHPCQFQSPPSSADLASAAKGQHVEVEDDKKLASQTLGEQHLATPPPAEAAALPLACRQQTLPHTSDPTKRLAAETQVPAVVDAKLRELDISAPIAQAHAAPCADGLPAQNEQETQTPVLAHGDEPPSNPPIAHTPDEAPRTPAKAHAGSASAPETLPPAAPGSPSTTMPDLERVFAPRFADFELLCTNSAAWPCDARESWRRPAAVLTRGLADSGVVPPPFEQVGNEVMQPCTHTSQIHTHTHTHTHTDARARMQ